MELPRVDPIGVMEWPAEPGAGPRRFSRGMRALAALLLVLFALVTVVTSAVSLGAYCITTEPGDVRTLPR
jgi:hypothetical protein